MSRRLTVLLVALLPLSAGCATIVGGGSSQAVSIEAAPTGARYVIRSSSGIEVSSGSVPASIRLPRKNEYQLDISLPGYQPRTVALSRGTNGWIWGNLVIGWILGFVVDFATGSAYKLEPAFVNVALESTGDQDFALVTVFDEERQVVQEERLLLEPAR